MLEFCYEFVMTFGGGFVSYPIQEIGELVRRLKVGKFWKILENWRLKSVGYSDSVRGLLVVRKLENSVFNLN